MFLQHVQKTRDPPSIGRVVIGCFTPLTTIFILIRLKHLTILPNVSTEDKGSPPSTGRVVIGYFTP